MRAPALLLGALLGWFGLLSAAQSHDARYALTTIDWNTDAKVLEVVHRLHTPHAFEAAALVQGTPNGEFQGTRSLAALGLYVDQRFSITDPQQGALVLGFVGAEVEGDYVFVYQEVRCENAPQVLAVRDDILADLQPSQINQVNIRLGEDSSTLVFTQATRGKALVSAAP
ncbi:MAG: DUF6702 family protein [Pseudomonadota bacterium]